MDDFLIFVSVNPSEFRNLISNLLNNSIFWTQDTAGGKVTVSVETDEQFVRIHVIDNGTGMTREQVKEIERNQPKSHRQDGSGIGLKNAEYYVKTWNGQLFIKSEIEKGTSITIQLPRSPIPEWCVSTIFFRPKSKILVLDDDASIHKIWHERLRNDPDFCDINIIQLHDGALLKETIELNPDIYLFLIDQEFLHQEKNGIDLIADLGISKRSILVTSKWNDKNIIERCKSLNIKILPKPMAGHVLLIYR